MGSLAGAKIVTLPMADKHPEPAPAVVRSPATEAAAAPSKPAAAMARSFPSSVPLIETVAIEVFIPDRILFRQPPRKGG